MPVHLHRVPKLQEVVPSFTDYAAGALAIVFNVMYLIGSIFFLEAFPQHIFVIGAWLFIIASLGVILLSLKSFYDSFRRYKVAVKEHNRADIYEIIETAMYLLSGIVFAIGTWLFLPGWENDNDAWHGFTWGAWFFIFGSFGFVIAVFYNGMNLHRDLLVSDLPEWHRQNFYKLHSVGLFCSLLGSVLFVSGSFYYRPAVANICERDDYCRTTYQSGTMCFIIGSFLFVLQTSFLFVASIISGVGTHEEAEDGDEDIE